METKEEINRTIGIRLAALCGSFRIPTKELAGAIGISVRQMNRILEAEASMSAAQLVLAARRIGVTTAIITGEEKLGEAAQ